MAIDGFARIFGSFRIGKHKRTSSEGNPIAAAAGRESTSSSDSVGWGNTRTRTTGTSTASVAAARFKRVIVVVDHSNEARLALLWALSHVVHKLDVVTLLYVSESKSSIAESNDSQENSSDRLKLRRDAKCQELTDTFRSLCLERIPEVDVEVLVVQGDKGPTIVGQARKLDASLIVLGQRKFGFLWRFLRLRDGLSDYCIQNADCLTLAVRRKSKKVGGYLINSKWQKNFWLLA